MFIPMCTGKIKGGRVTEKKLRYEGSITLDKNLIEAAEFIPGQMVRVLNLNNGKRITTYVIEGKRGSGVICLNGPAARLFEVDDEIIVLATRLMNESEAKVSVLKIVDLEEHNRIKT